MFATPKQSGRASILGRTPLNTSISGRRSVQPTPRATPNVANRSARAEQILEETNQYVVKALNLPVPVQVQEALRGDLTSVSIKLHESGWAWLITGNRLLLWKFSSQQLTGQCRQISLPPSSAVVNWNADMIAVCSPVGDSTSHLVLLAASPEGNLYYWGNALQDTPPMVRASVDVGEGHSLALDGLGHASRFLLATSLGTLFVIATPHLSQTQLSVSQLQPPGGMLAGFGRRMSSLFFGSGGHEVQEARRVVTGHSGSTDGSIVFVLTKTSLQKWQIERSQEQMVYNAPLEAIVKEAVIQGGWYAGSGTGGSRPTTLQTLSLWMVDMQLSSEYVVILVAVTSAEHSFAEYGLALIQADSDVTPLSVDLLLRPNYRVVHKPGSEAALLNRCLHGAPHSSTVLVYNRNMVILADVKSKVAAGNPDIVNFPTPNTIVGAGALNGRLLFFTLNQGVISVGQGSGGTPTPHTASRLAASVVATPTLPAQGLPPTMSSRQPQEVGPEKTEQLHNAFMEYLDGTKSHREVAAACEAHFPPESFSSRLDTPLDCTVARLSEMVLNELPTSDPRWSDGGSRDSAGGSSSLIIIYQLEDKLQAHHKYLQFVTDVGLLDKLTGVSVRGYPVLTRWLLCEHAEKLTAAITLRKMHSQVVDQAIRQALQQRPGPAPRPGLTHQDVFYSQVSSIDDIFPALLDHQDSALHGLELPQERTQLVLGVAAVMEGMVHDAVQYRVGKAALYQSFVSTEGAEPEFLPWTASPGTRHCISQQLQVLLDVGVRDVESSQDRQTLWELVVSLCNLLFDGYQAQIASIKSNPSLSGRLREAGRNFETDRRKFLTPLLEHSQLRQAAELGEKYEDFRVLVQLCERTGNREQLREYMARFSAQGFSDFLFKQYLDNGQLQQLLSHSEDFPAELGQFLESHDNLSWLHHIATQDYSKAHSTLQRLAEKETKYVDKKKTLLSLGKLAALLSDSSHPEKAQDLGTLNHQLQLIEFQQNIPLEALEGSGVDPTCMPPLPPEEVIELYVGEKNPASDELSFICALEFLEFVYPDRDSAAAQELRTYIWSQAVLKDDWYQLSTDGPLEQLQTTFFFKVAEEVYNRGWDVLALLPPLASLLSSRTLVETGIASDPTFQFLVRAGYEQIGRVQGSAATLSDSFIDT